MQYETIILELMARIKVLETDVSNLKETVRNLENQRTVENIVFPEADAIEVDSQNSAGRTSTTKEMMDTCYTYGKMAYHNPDANIGDYANQVARESGMNRNSAFMYIYAVKSMLSGIVFKRAISNKAIERYLNTIYNDCGKEGLRTALKSINAYAEYRKEYDLPIESILAMCEKFQEKIR